MTPDALSKLRKRLPDCELLLYADVASGTVLVSDTRLVHPQENLDTICACARAFLNAPRLSSHDLAGEVVFRTPTSTRVFMRALADDKEALACVFGPGVDLKSVLEAMRTALADAAPEFGQNVIAFKGARAQ